MASSSSSTTVEVKKHDVFLSFCGVDTRNTFTSTLCGILKSRSINVFIDDELERGEHISSSLMNEISHSMISVIILSEGYASSRWCLEELVKILECRDTQKQGVIPVFYHIYPSDVRNQAGNFGEGFKKLVESYDEEKLKRVQITKEQFKDKVLQWKNALTEAANISGRSTQEDPFDYYLANKVVQDIWRKLNIMIPTNEYKKLVGVESTIRHIEDLLRTRLRNVHAIGIWGMPGIGKTTIANCVFNQISSCFEASYFAENIREESMSPNGLNPMRQQLLSTILKHYDIVIDSKVKKTMFSRKRVLIVFDDVTTLSQLECLVEDIYCFGLGSQIIITTTDRQVLRSCGVGETYIYEMMGLPEHEALQLFRWYGFQQSNPSKDYDDLTKRVVKYAKGVPLVLKVLGCHLLGKSIQIWESAINRLKRIPHKDIYNVLKVCYEGLNDDEQNIFLDIACFLKLEKKDFVMDFLYACGLEAEIGLSVLIDKCLVTISRDNKVTMHNLLQDMGREIVRQESTKYPGLRSRLWYHKDINNVLKENKMSNAIEGICLDMSKQAEIIFLQPFSFGVMDQLRFFKLHNLCYEVNNINKVYVSQGLSSVSTELRYVCWHGCPLKSLQPNFLSKNLVALDMPHSNIEQLWSSAQKLRRRDLIKTGRSSICCPGSEIPEWFVFQSIGSFITLPPQINFFSSCLICVVVEFRDYHNRGQGLAVGFEWSLTDENGVEDVFHGTWSVWDYGTGPDYVDSDHVLLAYDLTFKFSGPILLTNKRYRDISIRFQVENSYAERLDRCKVKKCAVQGEGSQTEKMQTFKASSSR